MRKTAAMLAFGACMAAVVSIAAFNILLIASVAAILAARQPLRLPPVKWPLGLFLLGTLISLAFSANPAAGWPQIRKFEVFLTLLAVATLLGSLLTLRRLFQCWAALAAFSACWGFGQFAEKALVARPPGQSFYEFYMGDRITGAMSHWMTFGSQGMMALLMLAALLLFGPPLAGKLRWAALACAAAIGGGLVLGLTRAVWLGAALGAIYLLWFWKRWAVVALPAALLAGLLASPPFVRERALSIFQPRQNVDSNEFRAICRQVGYAMIQRHPWLGLGPEMVKYEFRQYPRPRPSGFYEHLHNLYIQYAAERGIPTMLMLVWLLLKALTDFARAIHALPPGRSDRRFLLHGAVAVILGTMAVGLFEVNLGDSEVLAMFLVVLAAGYHATAIDPASSPAPL